MYAAAERQRTAVVAIQLELVRVRELTRISVGGADDRDEALSGAYLESATSMSSTAVRP